MKNITYNFTYSSLFIIYLGTWNVRTMLQPEVAEQILQTEVQIIALQEIRWKGQGQIKKDKYNLYYSCKEGQTG